MAHTACGSETHRRVGAISRRGRGVGGAAAVASWAPESSSSSVTGDAVPAEVARARGGARCRACTCRGRRATCTDRTRSTPSRPATRSRGGPSASPRAATRCCGIGSGSPAARSSMQQLELRRAVGLADRRDEVRRAAPRSTRPPGRSAPPSRSHSRQTRGEVDEVAAQRVLQRELERARAELAPLRRAARGRR